MEAKLKCCPHCSRDLRPSGEKGLCWYCGRPLPREFLNAASPPGPEAPAPERVAVPYKDSAAGILVQIIGLLCWAVISFFISALSLLTGLVAEMPKHNNSDALIASGIFFASFICAVVVAIRKFQARKVLAGVPAAIIAEVRSPRTPHRDGEGAAAVEKEAKAPARGDGLAAAARILGVSALILALLLFLFPAFFLSNFFFTLLFLQSIPARAALLLLILGPVTLVVGGKALIEAKEKGEGREEKSGALTGIASGAILICLAPLLFLGPLARMLEARYANGLLNSLQGKESGWNYGNSVHDANLRLGFVALKEGKMEEAKQFLLAAGRTPGSPQLDSYGPDMSLAQGLLLKGEKETVLEYFDLCGNFWHSKDKLDDWALQVKQGKLPDFSGNCRLGKCPPEGK